MWAGPTHPEVDKTTMIPRVRVLFTQQVSLEVFLESLESLNVTQVGHKDLTSLLMSTHLCTGTGTGTGSGSGAGAGAGSSQALQSQNKASFKVSCKFSYYM